MLVKFKLGESKPKHLTCEYCNITEGSVRTSRFGNLCDDCYDNALEHDTNTILGE